MKMLIWNVRGVGNSISQRTVKRLLLLHSPRMLVLIEPKTIFVEQKFKKLFGFDTCFIHSKNKIWIFSYSSDGVELILDHSQFMHVTVHSLTLQKFSCTFVYGKCSRAERIDLWNGIRSLQMQSMPWMLGGDFNAILCASEKKRGGLPSRRSMMEFHECLIDSGLQDAGFSGSPFTWNNGTTWERLDRVLHNDAWIDLFPKTSVQHHPRKCSDHHLLEVSFLQDNSSAPSPFRFLNCWVQHPGFLHEVKHNWEPPTGYSGVLNLQQKLFRVKKHLQTWNKSTFGNIFDKITALEADVAQSERKYDEDPSAANRAAMKEKYAFLAKALAIEEAFWKQKAACRWLEDGERNTKFFHSQVKKNRLKLGSALLKIEGPLLLILN